MTMSIPSELKGDARQNLTVLTHVLYGLHTLSWFSAGLLAFVAIIVNYVKRPDLSDDFFRSHFRWQARSFWFTLLWLALTAPLFLLLFLPGVAAWSLVGLWYLYRCIRGWWSLADGKAMPMPTD